jgi:hypothetical protein
MVGANGAPFFWSSEMLVKVKDVHFGRLKGMAFFLRLNE